MTGTLYLGYVSGPVEGLLLFSFISIISGLYGSLRIYFSFDGLIFLIRT
jgi:hypothetical protein